jgi:hypothetical protein
VGAPFQGRYPASEVNDGTCPEKPDQLKMRSVSVLVDFMSADSGWKQLRHFGDKAVVFQKVRERVLDVTWHMQAWTLGIGARPAAEKDVASDGAQSAVGEL